MDQDRRWCAECQRYTLARRQQPQVLLHSLLIIVTCGLWLPVAMALIVRGWWRCQKCGSET